MSDRTYPIPVSNGILTRTHHKQIGPALWVFLWMIDRETPDDGRGPGRVLHGNPIELSDITKSLDEDLRTVRRHIDRLVEHDYLSKIVHGKGKPHGYIISNPKKWLFRSRVQDKNVRSDDAPTEDKNGHQVRTKMVPTEGTNVHTNKEDITYITNTTDKAGEDDALTKAKAAGVRDLDRFLQVRKNLAQPGKAKPEAQESRPAPDSAKPPADDRRKEFLALIDAHIKATIPNEEARPQFKSFIRALDTFMETYKDLQPDGFRRWLEHRAGSDNANFTENPRVWLSALSKYASGPRDRWNQLKGQKPSQPRPVPISNFATEQRRKIERATADRMNGESA